MDDWVIILAIYIFALIKLAENINERLGLVKLSIFIFCCIISSIAFIGTFTQQVAAYMFFATFCFTLLLVAIMLLVVLITKNVGDVYEEYEED
jgi:hypothetical protein